MRPSSVIADSRVSPLRSKTSATVRQNNSSSGEERIALPALPFQPLRSMMKRTTQ